MVNIHQRFGGFFCQHTIGGEGCNKSLSRPPSVSRWGNGRSLGPWSDAISNFGSFGQLHSQERQCDSAWRYLGQRSCVVTESEPRSLRKCEPKSFAAMRKYLTQYFSYLLDQVEWAMGLLSLAYVEGKLLCYTELRSLNICAGLSASDSWHNPWMTSSPTDNSVIVLYWCAPPKDLILLHGYPIACSTTLLDLDFKCSASISCSCYSIGRS